MDEMQRVQAGEMIVLLPEGFFDISFMPQPLVIRRSICAASSLRFAACTVFSSTLYAFLPEIKPVMQVFGEAYMLILPGRQEKAGRI
ncbi:MAG: hypothetical protein NC211_00855 [Alistipes senegalensis]|nr:hypothetical protein [Oxalobacter formigenes]MCM1280374.1 hypothetical protein [Alistipes senegalensis]